MRSAFGVEHEPISKAGAATVAGAVTKPKVPGVPTPDPTKFGAAKWLAKEKVKKNPIAATAVAGGAAGATGIAGGYAAGQQRPRNRF